MEMMVGMAGFDLPIWTIRQQVASAIQIVVQVSRMMGGQRKVVRVSEITGMEGDVISMHDIFEFAKLVWMKTAPWLAISSRPAFARTACNASLILESRFPSNCSSEDSLQRVGEREMTPAIITVFAFIAAFLGVLGVNALLLDLTSRERKRMRQRLDEQYRARQRDKIRLESVNLSQIAADVRADHETDSIVDKAKFVLEQSGLDMTWSRLVVLTIASGVMLAAVGTLTLNYLPLTIAFGMFGALLPFAYVFLKRHERLKRLRAQLPDALDLMSRVMRSGQSISQAMQAVAQEFSQPLALEFLYCHEQMNMGLSAEVALRQLAKRAGLLEVKIFVLAVVVQRQTGGNLAELLDKLGEVIRERFRIDGMIQSLTAQGRFQAMILLSLPPFMFVLLMVINPEYEMQLFDYPGCHRAGSGIDDLGAVMVNRIVNFDY